MRASNPGETIVETTVNFTLNGKRITHSFAPYRTLLEVLRDDLRLTGSKEGCGEGDCGACSGINASGPVVPYSMSEGVNSPSIDGSSAVFWLGGTTPWGSAIWWKQLGGNDGIAHCTYNEELI